MKAPFVSAVPFLAALAWASPPKPVPGALEWSEATASLATTGNATFEQLIDHNNPSLGTFSQQYWYNFENWAGPGSPIIFFTPGEAAAAPYTGYLTNRTVQGLFAEAVGGANLLVEHRYWGGSSPYENLTTEALQYLTLDQSIADFTYFAQNVDLPFDTNHSSNSANAPWVFSGGSYSGALAAWVESTAPGTFWAYHASSAPVEAISDYWQYFSPVQQGMPQNCSKDVSLVIDYVDKILTKGNDSAKYELKAKFGLEGVEHDDDFASALQNGPWLWQSNSFYSNYSGFYQFCDAIEGVTAGANSTPSAAGVGLEKALAGYANWVNTTLIPGYCQGYGYTDEYDLSCFDTYNASMLLFTDYSVGNAGDRQWNWFLCNEPFDYWQDGAPSNVSSIVSRLVTADYWQRQCALWFPETNGYTYGSTNPAVNVDAVNQHTQGWKLENTTRLIWTNGEFDPWRTSGVSSEYRPGGPLPSTTEHPLQIIPGGFHCSDLIVRNGAFNAGVQEVIDNEIAQIKTWVEEFYTQ